ncbi:MAG: hypothetical protein H7Y43_08070 [Akkermansiaceae bacterium]|nr:hypothetical protein [Verrucomicrobiales bacterium]
MKTVETRKASFSIPSIIALVAAIFSFTTGAFWGFVLAIIAMFFGVIGVLLSFSRNRRGGAVSMLSLGAGMIGLIAALIKALQWLL